MSHPTDDSFLADTLHRGAADVQTPFDTIASGSMAAGRRIKRRRAAAVVLGSVACVAAVSAGVVGLTHLAPSGTASDPGFASGPSGPAETTSSAPTDTTGTPTPAADAVPVHLMMAGWTCEEFPQDQKSWCTGPDGVNGSLNWRPATESDAWHGGDPDKTDLYVSDVHGRWFATIGLTENDKQLAHELGAHLVWD